MPQEKKNMFGVPYLGHISEVGGSDANLSRSDVINAITIALMHILAHGHVVGTLLVANHSTCTIPQSVASNGWHVWLLRLKSSQLEFVCCRVHKLALGERCIGDRRESTSWDTCFIYIRHLVRDIEVA